MSKRGISVCKVMFPLALTVLFVANITAKAPSIDHSGHGIFMDRCGACHGENGKGNGPADFDPRELEQLLADLQREAPADPDEAPALSTDTVTRLGDLWLLGKNHRLLCADSTQPGQLERLLDGASSDMVFTDLPYNADYQGKTLAALTDRQRQSRRPVQSFPGDRLSSHAGRELRRDLHLHVFP